jgi:hypothetical protein
MADQTSNDRAQAAMREENSTNLNTSGKNGVVLNPPKQESAPRRPTHHVDPGTGKRL